MRRTVTADLDLEVSAPASVVLSLAVARVDGIDVDENLVPGAAEHVERLEGADGTVRHLLHLPVGSHHISYRAQADGHGTPLPGGPAQEFEYALPSRYCESDELPGPALALFGGAPGMDTMNQVRAWVYDSLDYVLGSSRVTDGAVRTFLAREGVCRDFAHLTIALLRARGIPARLVAAYAPGLDPMDFHAVAEVWVDGGWYIVDSTGLAPRQSLLRICTGRDAVDTSFMTTLSGSALLQGIQVSAVVDGSLPTDDQTAPVQMG